MKRFVIAAVAAAVVAAPLAGTAGAVVNGTVVAGPGGFVSPGTYYTPVVTMTQGSEASFNNADIAPHDVTAVAKKKKKPLFRSALVGIGQSAPVVGTDKLAAGRYEFYCTRHRWMTGTLIVQ